MVAGDCLVPSTMGIMQQLGARATLIVVNVICLIFSCILIFYGTTGMGARTPAGAGGVGGGRTHARHAGDAGGIRHAKLPRGGKLRASAGHAVVRRLPGERTLGTARGEPAEQPAAAARRPRLPRDAHGGGGCRGLA